MTDYILKAVAELREKCVKWEAGKEDSIIPMFEQYLTQKLEHLAKQKDEEFMGMLEDESAIKGSGKQNFHDGRYDPMAEIRNNLRAELRNKLQEKSI